MMAYSVRRMMVMIRGIVRSVYGKIMSGTMLG